MLNFHKNRGTGTRVKKLSTPRRFNTYICGWLIENRDFLRVIDETTLVQIFEKLISLIDLITDEMETRLRENGFVPEQELKIRQKAKHLRYICFNFQSYDLVE